MWGLCAILTAFDVFEAGDEARTDKNLQLLKNADWVRVPYPCKNCIGPLVKLSFPKEMGPSVGIF
jgi:hypothetical protein